MAQAFPHAPQFLKSLTRSKHSDPQADIPGSQFTDGGMGSPPPPDAVEEADEELELETDEEELTVDEGSDPPAPEDVEEELDETTEELAGFVLTITSRFVSSSVTSSIGSHPGVFSQVMPTAQPVIEVIRATRIVAFVLLSMVLV